MSRGFFFAFAEREFRVEPSAPLALFLKAAGLVLAGFGLATLRRGF